MSKKERPINAFIIDDKQDYIDSLKTAARAKRILLKSSTNLEMGMEAIEKDKGIDFVILDGRCFIDQDQELTGTTATNIPIRAKSKLDKINHDQNRNIQFCVNTGFSDDKGMYEGVFTIFEKTDHEALLDHIKEALSNSESYQLKNKYVECFDVFDLGIVDSKYEPILLDVLQSLDKGDFRKKNMTPMRDFLEAIYHGLMGIGCIPNSFLNTDGNPNLEWCTRYMEERPTNDADNNPWTLQHSVPQEIKSIFRKLKESTSAFSHLQDTDIIKAPFLANAYSLFELLEWLPTFYNAHYK